MSAWQVGPSGQSSGPHVSTGQRFLLFVGVLVAALMGCSGGARPASAPAARPSSAPGDRFGVLLMAHGGPPEWNAAVLEATAPLRSKYAIEVAFGMADATSLQDSVSKLEARDVRRIAVVRLFVSGESFVEETEKILGLRAGAPASKDDAAPSNHDAHAGHGAAAGHDPHAGHAMAFFRLETRSSFALSTEGLSDGRGMGAVLADRAAALSKAPENEDVLVLAHGPGDDAENARWLAKLDARAASIRARAPFRRVQVETLREDWPDKRTSAEARIRAFVKRASVEHGTAIVVPFRVQGFGPYADVLKDLDYVADRKGLLPHVEITRWLEHQIGLLEAGPFRSPAAAAPPVSPAR